MGVDNKISAESYNFLYAFMDNRTRDMKGCSFKCEQFGSYLEKILKAKVQARRLWPKVGRK